MNAQGQVVGMNTAVASTTTGNAPTQNIGFAIAVDSVKPLLASLRRGGTGGAGQPGPPLNAGGQLGLHRGDGGAGDPVAPAARTTSPRRPGP